jgi:hypothetical protein
MVSLEEGSALHRPWTEKIAIDISPFSAMGMAGKE